MFYWEISGTFFALLGVYFTAQKKIWCWPLSIMGVLIYAYIFFQSKLYADAGLQIIYFFLSVYGWMYWEKTFNAKDFNYQQMTFSQHLATFGIAGSFGFFLYFVLKNYTDSDIAFFDAFTTSFSLVASYWMAKKYLQHWLYWIVIDIVYTGIYLYKNLYVTTLQYFIFFILALYGYICWKSARKDY